MTKSFRETIDVGELSFCREVFSDGTQHLQFCDDCNTVGFTIDEETVMERDSTSFKFKTKTEQITVEFDRERPLILRVLVNNSVLINCVKPIGSDFGKIVNSMGDVEGAVEKLKLDVKKPEKFSPKKNPFLPENRFDEERIDKLTDGQLNAFKNDIADSVERILDKANRYYWCGKITETELSDIITYIVRDVIERRQK